MRSWLVRLHRWFGLAIALFLFVAGLTGAVIAWDHELDAALNPVFFVAKSSAPALSPLELANRIEAADPRLEVTYLPLAAEPGHTLQIGVSGRTNLATGTPYELGFNQLAVEPATGEIQARREWGAVSVSRLELIPFIYKLHYSLHLPIRGGIDLGMWLMGIVGIVWLVDSVIAIALAFPTLKSWRKSFMFRVRRGGYALTFDLHRSGGVWVWSLLMAVALTSIAMNLTNPVMRPLVSLFSPLGSTPFSDPGLTMPPSPTASALSRERVALFALAEHVRRWLFRARQRSRRCRSGQRMALLERADRQAGGRSDSGPGISRRHLHAGPIPTSFGAHHWIDRKDHGQHHGCRCSDAERDRPSDLVEEGASAASFGGGI